MTVQAVVFDAGETLIDETRFWSDWADWLGVPRLTFMAVLGAVIARGEHHRRVFEVFEPGFDLEEALAERARSGEPHGFLAEDLYPDAQPCLERLKAGGYRIGIAGNYGIDTETSIADLGFSADFVGSSERWGAEKPSLEFFLRAVEMSGFSPDEVAYVGDRVDNDVAGAVKAGMFAIQILRGPWALLLPDVRDIQPHVTIRSLEELPGVLSPRPEAP